MGDDNVVATECTHMARKSWIYSSYKSRRAASMADIATEAAACPGMHCLLVVTLIDCLPLRINHRTGLLDCIARGGPPGCAEWTPPYERPLTGSLLLLLLLLPSRCSLLRSRLHTLTFRSQNSCRFRLLRLTLILAAAIRHCQDMLYLHVDFNTWGMH